MELLKAFETWGYPEPMAKFEEEDTVTIQLPKGACKVTGELIQFYVKGVTPLQPHAMPFVLERSHIREIKDPNNRSILKGESLCPSKKKPTLH